MAKKLDKYLSKLNDKTKVILKAVPRETNYIEYSFNPSLAAIFENSINLSLQEESFVNNDRVLVSNKTASKVVKEIYKDLKIKELEVENTLGSIAGIELAKRYYNALLDKYAGVDNLLDFNSYYIFSEEDMFKNSFLESISFINANELKDIIVIYVKNKMTTDTQILLSNKDNIIDFFEMANFKVEIVKRNEVTPISEAIKSSLKSRKPTLIVVNSEYEKTNIEFSQEIVDINEKIENRSDKKVLSYTTKYEKLLSSKNNKVNEILEQFDVTKIKLNLDNIDFQINDEFEENMLISNSKIMNIISKNQLEFIGGSVSNQNSTNTFIKNCGYNTSLTPIEKNIILENRLSSSPFYLDGLSSLNLLSYVSSNDEDFMEVFATFEKTKRKKILIISSVDQNLNILDSTKTLVFKPADINELIGSWNHILKSHEKAIIVVPNKIMPKLENTNSKFVKYGGYIAFKEENKLNGIILASGTNVLDAINIAEKLLFSNVYMRVITVPCLNIFLKQNKVFEEEIIPKKIRVFTLSDYPNLVMNRFASFPAYAFDLKSYKLAEIEHKIKAEFYQTENLK